MARQRAGLGRGLNALMGIDESNNEVNESKEKPVIEEAGKETDQTRKATTNRVKKTEKKTGELEEKTTDDRDSFEVELSKIEANPDQPRTHFDEDELNELADSIKKNGLLQPILVRKIGDKYQIIAGERRWQACKKIKLEKVPVRVTEADDIKSIALAMIENIQRSNLNPMEEAYGYRMLMERNNMTQAEVAEQVSKGRSTVANTLRLLDLPEDAQQLLFEGSITAGHARAILSIPSEEGRAALTRRLVEQTMSVREAENLARLLAGRKNEGATRTPLPAHYKKVAKGLRDALDTNVRVKTVKGKNKIEIEFKDDEELEDIFKRIVRD